MREPKLFFDDAKEMYDLLNEWQERLHLQDWLIAIALVNAEDMELEGTAGECDVQWVNKCGTISILKQEDMPTDMIMKQPQEQTLIHELLHFKFYALEDRSREENYFEMKQHQLLEELSKSLYMAKYDIDLSWFIVDEVIV